MDYNYLFIWTGFLFYVSIARPSRYPTIENGYFQLKTKKKFAIISFIPIIYFVVTSTWRYWGDYYSYLNSYNRMSTDSSELFLLIANNNKRGLLFLLEYTIKILSGGNVYAYRLTLALIQAIPIAYMLRRYSVCYVFSIFLFLVNSIPLAWMLNGVRQLCAASIIYGATQFYIDKKYKKTLLVILLATLFHQTAILMFAVVFICQGKAWNRKTLFSIGGAIIFVILVSRISGLFDVLLTEAGYNSYYYKNDNGVHPLRVLVSAVPPFLAFLARSRIAKEDSKVINFCVNMSLLTFGIYLVAMVTSGILVGRIPLYTSMYNYILLPYLINNMFSGKNRQLMYLITIVMYYFYYLIQ